jgi:hypothetical protein
MKKKEIATRLYEHLKKLENDKEYNVRKKEGGLTPLFQVNVWATNRAIHVVYVSFQGDSLLTDEEAIAYLNWLDAGNKGKHWESLWNKI